MHSRSKAGETREAWLLRAVARLGQVISEAGYQPPRAHVSVGFPSRGALRSAQQRIGECWAGASSSDGVPHVFVSPLLGDPVRVLDVLLHELCHAATPGAGHRGSFAKLARAVGLEGKLTATVAGSDLRARLQLVLSELGPYPHPELTSTGPRRVQSTRMLKVACRRCGYALRTTRRWLDVGLPTCCCGGVMEAVS